MSDSRDSTNAQTSSKVSDRLTLSTWCALRTAVNAALAGGPGGDFTDEDIEHMEVANAWLCKIGESRGYFDKLDEESTS